MITYSNSFERGVIQSATDKSKTLKNLFFRKNGDTKKAVMLANRWRNFDFLICFAPILIIKYLISVSDSSSAYYKSYIYFYLQPFCVQQKSPTGIGFMSYQQISRIFILIIHLDPILTHRCFDHKVYYLKGRKFREKNLTFTNIRVEISKYHWIKFCKLINF